MKNRNKSYAKSFEEAEVMLSGITAYKERLANRGINDRYIAYLRALIDSGITLRNKQREAMAARKNLTRQIAGTMDQLDKEFQFCKVCVKINMPKTIWGSFGFIYRERKPKSKTVSGNPPADTPPAGSHDEPPVTARGNKTVVKRPVFPIFKSPGKKRGLPFSNAYCLPAPRPGFPASARAPS